MKKLVQDFKAFISRGNIIDMSVGVIIGSAFSAIVTALTNKIITPLINSLLALGGDGGLEKAYTFLKKVYEVDATTGNVTSVVDLTKSIYIDWGAFITAIINFFLIALVLFTIMKVVKKANEVVSEFADNVTNKELKAEFKAVKKQAKAEKRSVVEAWEEYKAEKAKKLEEEKKAEEARKAEEERQNRLANPTTEDLLKDIKALLEKQSENK